MRCVIFAAVSTQAQVGNSENPKESIPAQIASARHLIESRETWAEVHEPLVVDGQSRAVDWLDQAVSDIPAFASLLDLADGDKIDLVIIRDYDRLARSQLLLDQIRFRLRQNQVQIYSLNQPSEPLPPNEATRQPDSAFLLESLGGMMAEWENRVRVRRAQMGMRARVKRGFHPGTSPPYGYRIEDDRLVIIPEQAKAVRLIFQRYLAGWGTPTIVEELNNLGIRTRQGRIWSHVTVLYILRNPVYAGYVSLGRTRVRRTPKGRTIRYRPPSDEWLIAPGNQEPIISKETWEAALKEAERRRFFRPRRQNKVYPLSGLLHCGYCGSLMHVVASTPKRSYYGCSKYSTTGECQRNSVRVDLVERDIINHLETAIKSPDFAERLEDKRTERECQQLEDRVSILESQAAKLRAALYRWTRDYEEGLLERSDFYELRADTGRRLDNVQAELELTEKELESLDVGERSRQELRNILEASESLESLARDEQRRVLHQVFTSILVKDGELSFTEWL